MPFTAEADRVAAAVSELEAALLAWLDSSRAHRARDPSGAIRAGICGGLDRLRRYLLDLLGRVESTVTVTQQRDPDEPESP